MKTPAEYVASARTEYPDAGPVPVVTVADAETAVFLALADAERYRNLLLRAVRNSTTPPPCAPPPASS